MESRNQNGNLRSQASFERYGQEPANRGAEELYQMRRASTHEYNDYAKDGNDFQRQEVMSFEASIRRSLTIKIYTTLTILIIANTIMTIGLYLLLTKFAFKSENGVIKPELYTAYLATEIALVIVGTIGYTAISIINVCCMNCIGRCGTFTLLILAPIFSSLLFTGLSMLTDIVVFGSSLLCVFCILLFCTSIALCLKKDAKIWIAILVAFCISQLLWILYPILVVWRLLGDTKTYTIMSVVSSVLICLVFSIYLIVDTWLVLNKSTCSEWAEYALRIYTDIVNLLVTMMNLIGIGRR